MEKVKYSLRMPKHINRKLHQVSEYKNISISSILNQLAYEYCNEELSKMVMDHYKQDVLKSIFQKENEIEPAPDQSQMTTKRNISWESSY